MKQLTILILFTLFSIVISGQTTNSHRYSIPGFVQINDTLFISRYKVSIRDYACFLLYLYQKAHDTATLKACMPAPNFTDWTVWNAYDKKLVKLDDYLFVVGDTSISFTSFTGNLPVVNLGLLQANNYCKYKADDYKLWFIVIIRT
jgi:hypothetical protein